MIVTITNIEKRYKVISCQIETEDQTILVNPSDKEIYDNINEGELHVIYTYEKLDLVELDSIKYYLCGDYKFIVKGKILNDKKHFLSFNNMEIELVKNHINKTYNMLLFVEGKERPIVFLNNLGEETPSYLVNKNVKIYDINK
jgi:hypothetical protein